MNRLTKLAPYGVGLLAILGVVAAPQAAQAHTPTFVTSCTQIALQLQGYPAGSTTTAVVDGKTAWSATFGAEGFQDSVNFAPNTRHDWTVSVVSSDGPRYSFTETGATPASCITPPPVVTPPVEPPVVVPPVEPPVVVTPPVEPPVVVTPPVEPPVVTPPVVVVEPRVQDYITCDGGAFVLDNTASTAEVTYLVQGVTFVVPAGEAVHTDADGTRLQPIDGTYTVTAGDRSWSFASVGNCPTEEPPVVTPPTDEPTTPVEEPTTPSTPVEETPAEEPTAEPTTPVTIAPVLTETPAPAAVIVPAETPAAVAVASTETPDGLAFTGSTANLWAAIGGSLGLALLGLGAVLVARRRQVALDSVEDES